MKKPCKKCGKMVDRKFRKERDVVYCYQCMKDYNAWIGEYYRRQKSIESTNLAGPRRYGR